MFPSKTKLKRRAQLIRMSESEEWFRAKSLEKVQKEFPRDQVRRIGPNTILISKKKRNEKT